jgi:hypothetical protein
MPLRFSPETRFRYQNCIVDGSGEEASKSGTGVTEVGMERAGPNRPNQPNQSKRWQELAAEASTEIDGMKLMELVAELCEEFDRGRERPNRIPQISAEDTV